MTKTVFQLWAMTKKKKWKLVAFYSSFDQAEHGADMLPNVPDGYYHGMLQWKEAEFKILRVEEVVGENDLDVT